MCDWEPSEEEAERWRAQVAEMRAALFPKKRDPVLPKEADKMSKEQVRDFFGAYFKSPCETVQE